MAVEGQGQVTTVLFLGKEVGLACMAKLLGVGTTRLRRSRAFIPDLRMGQLKTGSTKDTFSIDAFFTTLHEAVAETLPDRRPRRNSIMIEITAFFCCYQTLAARGG